MNRHPRARAANTKDFLVFLERVRPGAIADLRAAEPPEVFAIIENSARTDWIDIDSNGIHVTEIVRLLGKESARDAWRKYTSDHFIRSPAIRALFDGAVRMFGLSISSVVKRIPHMFEQSYRDCGRMGVAWREGEAVVRLEDIPDELARFPAYTVLFHGVFLGLYDVVQTPPRLDYAPELASRHIVARFKW
jgi:hypothetical protein